MRTRGFEMSEIQIVPIKPRDGLVAFASFVLSGALYIGDVGIHVRPTGEYRLVYPARTLPNGKVISAVHPIDRPTADAIQQAVVNKLESLPRKCDDQTYVEPSPST